jgi:hypothetical protein
VCIPGIRCSYVVKTGMNFGADYCIYHTLQANCHSEMCVTVVDATAYDTPPPSLPPPSVASAINVSATAAAPSPVPSSSSSSSSYSLSSTSTVVAAPLPPAEVCTAKDRSNAAAVHVKEEGEPPTKELQEEPEEKRQIKTIRPEERLSWRHVSTLTRVAPVIPLCFLVYRLKKKMIF